MRRLWRWLTGCWHRWETFQTGWRLRCRKCGRIVDCATGERWPDYAAYIGDKGVRVKL